MSEGVGGNGEGHHRALTRGGLRRPNGAVVVGQPLQRAFQRALTAPGDPRRTRVIRQWITSSLAGET